MGLFGSPRVEGEDLKRCLEYLEAEARIIAFQTKEAKLYSSKTLQYGKSIKENPTAVQEMYEAAKRLAQASAEVLRRHHEIKDVPEVAKGVRSAWRLMLRANAMWAITAEELAEEMSTGLNPDWSYVQQLVEDYEKARARAESEHKKLVKRMKVSTEQLTAIFTGAPSVDSSHNTGEPTTNQ